jgi:phage tail tape-measure protein
MKKLITKFSALPALIVVMAICMNMTTPIQSGKILSESKYAINDYSVFMVEESWTWGTFFTESAIGAVSGAVSGAAVGAFAGAVCSPFGSAAGVGTGAALGAVGGTVLSAVNNVYNQATNYFGSSNTTTNGNTSAAGNGNYIQGQPKKIAYISEIVLD